MFFLMTCFLFFSSCSTIPLKKIKNPKARNIELSLIVGNLNVDKYKTISRVEVHVLEGEKKKLTEKKIELSEFKVNKQIVSVSDSGEAQFKYWVTDVKGDVDLKNMGFPPKGEILLEIVNKRAKVLAVKGFPEETIFYLPKIALPEKTVKPGDSWDYTGKWRSLKTGWPFKVSLKLKLKSWFFCGGLQCAHITYAGAVSLTKESLFKEAVLESRIKGEFVYAPIGHQFIWSYSNSVETFLSERRKVEVKSCTASYQISPDKENRVFSHKFRKSCNET